VTLPGFLLFGIQLTADCDHLQPLKMMEIDQIWLYMNAKSEREINQNKFQNGQI
jgi:hypothetical protein